VSEFKPRQYIIETHVVSELAKLLYDMSPNKYSALHPGHIHEVINQARQADLYDPTFIAFLIILDTIYPNWTAFHPYTWKFICDKDYIEASRSLDSSEWCRQPYINPSDFATALSKLCIRIRNSTYD
jgi:hypothetical protein